MKSKEKRAFLSAFFITFCILLTLTLLLLVDYRCRKMTLGDNTPLAEIVDNLSRSKILRISAFGQSYELDLTVFKIIWEKILDFCCLPHN